MQEFFSRRTFVQCAIGGLIGLPLAGASRDLMAKSKKQLFDISLAEWSLNRSIFSGKLNHLDFAKTAKREFDINAVEYVNQFFKDKAADRSYLREMKMRADDLGVRSLLIMVDNEGALGDADAARRKRAVENHYKWVDAAQYLGCHSVRVNAQSSGSRDEQLARAADGLRRLTEYGAARKINVIVENHGGLSSDGEWLAAVIKQVAHPRCGTLPDFGNFEISKGNVYDAYRGVSELMPYAKGVSAKSHNFDSRGRETSIDYEKMMRIVLGAGYRGFVGIEYEGGKISEMEGIRLTKRLLERVRHELRATA